MLANDTDADGDTLSATVTSGPANGTLTVAAGGGFTYTPDADYNGSDSFTYEVSDGNGGTDTATVNITVDPINDAPVANDDTFSGAEDTQIAGDVSTNDSDVDTGDMLTYTALTQPSNARLCLAVTVRSRSIRMPTSTAPRRSPTK